MTDQSNPEPGTEPPQSAVKYLRDQLGFSQEQLRTRAGVSRDTVQRLEQGKGVHASNIAKIAAALGVPVSAVRSLAAARMCIEARDAAEIDEWAKERVREQVARTQGWAGGYLPGQQVAADTPQAAHPVPPPAMTQQVIPPPGTFTPAPAPEPAPVPSRAADESALYQTLPQTYDPASIKLAVEQIKNWMATDPSIERDPVTRDALIDREVFESHIRVWATTATVAEPDRWEQVVREALRVAGIAADTGTAAN